MSAEARDAGYIRIAFMSDAVDGRSAARGRNTIVRQNDTFLQISATLGCGTSEAPSPLINLSRRASSRCSAALREERKRLPSWSRWGERAPTLERVALRVAIADFGMDLPR